MEAGGADAGGVSGEGQGAKINQGICEESQVGVCRLQSIHSGNTHSQPQSHQRAEGTGQQEPQWPVAQMRCSD